MIDEVGKLIKFEEKRQAETLMLIPSENYASQAVRKALGSALSNKYAEGYPGRRYYQGNKYIDEIENLAIDRAQKLFGVPHANVQPYSGSPANAEVLMATCEPGSVIMGLKLSGGGHLTHGHPNITFSGKFYTSVQFDVDDQGWLDYGQIADLAKQHQPRVIIAGTTAYPRTLDWAKFAEIAQNIGAYLVADISHIAGLVVGGVHPSPVPFAHIVTTTTHKTLRGPRGAMILVTQAGIAKDPDLVKKIDRAVFPGLQGGPHNATTAAIAITLEEAATKEFKKYAVQIGKNAQVLAKELIKYGFSLTTGGTDNHLLIVDLRHKNISGKEAAILLEEAGIVVNYNAVPHDPNPPANPSGIRLGPPAVTTRGMQKAEMVQIAKWMDQVIFAPGQAKKIAAEVKKLCAKFPTP